MNIIHLIGNVGKDAEVKSTQQGKQYISFSVAHTEKFGDQEKTTWFSCTKWVNDGGSTAVANYIKKGGKVAVMGNISARAYAGADGTPQASLDIRVITIELMGGTPQAGANTQATVTHTPTPTPTPTQKPQTQQPQPAFNDDDLPF